MTEATEVTDAATQADPALLQLRACMRHWLMRRMLYRLYQFAAAPGDDACFWCDATLIVT